MLRLFLRAVLPSLLFLAAASAFAQGPYDEGGYADRHGVAAGGTIAFYIATAVSPFNVEIVNLASPFTVLSTINGLTSQRRDCSGMWEHGCGWPLTTTFSVPSNFVTGYYAARFPTSNGVRYILFSVRPVVLGSHAPIAVIQPSNSDVAYNRFGGKSVYDSISDDGHRATVVSFNRPYFDDSGLARYEIWEDHFVRWMKSEGRPFEVLTDDDLEEGISLEAYKAVVIVGHAEYWSRNARHTLEQYSRGGGHVAVFGANTMWWQVRVDLEARQMTIYKEAAPDPLLGVDDDLVTVNWTDWPVLDPENRILGSSFLNAGYANKQENGDRVPIPDRIPYTVRNASHWVFAGTGVRNGDPIARSIASTETDGSIFNTRADGSVVVEGSDGTPLSYEILATLPASDGYSTIGFYTNSAGGGFFNGAGRDWARGLDSDFVVQQMTRNVLDRFATGAPFAYAPRRTPNRAEDLFNTPRAAPSFIPGWRYDRGGIDIAPRCAHEGASGLTLAPDRWRQIVRNLSVGRAGLTRAAVNLWIDASSLGAASFATPLIELLNFRGATNELVAVLEIARKAEGPSLRMTSYSGNAPVDRTSYIALTPGWHSVQFSWESGGMLTLNVSGQRVSTPNSVTGKSINALGIEFAGSVMDGYACVDELQLRDAFLPPSITSSTIDASVPSLPADGASTAEITVRLFDAEGDPLVNGGNSVTLRTTLGTLGPVISHGDGTYSSTLTAGTEAGTATVQALVDGSAIADTATVTFTLSFTDDPLSAGTTVKAVHIMELRSAVNAYRAAAGLTAATFTDASLTGVPFKAIHVLELRAALNEAREAAGLTPLQFSSPAPAPGLSFRAIHVQELRDALR
jgi:hypothetical protein